MWRDAWLERDRGDDAALGSTVTRKMTVEQSGNTNMEDRDDEQRLGHDWLVRLPSPDQSATRRNTTAVENHGSEPRQDGPGTRAGGSLDGAVAELVASHLADDVKQTPSRS